MFIRTIVVVVGGLVLAGCAGDDDAPQSATTAEPPAVTASVPSADFDDSGVAIPDLRPGEVPVGPYYDGIYGLTIGECFDLRRTTSSSGIVDFVLRVPCELAHQNEMFAETSYTTDSSDRYPGEEEMRSWALQFCYEAFETFVGVPYEQSAFEIGYDSPTQEYFEDAARSYRGVRCWVSSAGEDLATGSAAGTRR